MSPSSGRRRRRWLAGLATLVGAFLVVGVFVWQARLVLAERGLAWVITNQGLGPISLTVSRLDLNEAEIRDAKSKYGSIERITVDYTIGSLLQARALRLLIEGADLEFTLDDTPNNDQSPTAPETSPLECEEIVLPLDVISVRDSRILVNTNQGPVHLGAKNLTATQSVEGQNLMLVGGWLELPTHELVVSGVDGKLLKMAIENNIAINATLAQIRHTATPSFVTPLMASISAQATSKQITLSVQLRDPEGQMNVKIAGSYSPKTGDGTAHMTLDPLDLGAGGGITNLFPVAAQWITSAKGKVSLTGDFILTAQDLNTALSVNLDRVSLLRETIGVEDLTGTLQFDEIMPPTTRGRQHITATLKVPRLEPVPVDLAFRLAPGRLFLDSGKANILGGELAIKSATFDADSGTGAALVSVSNMDLSLISDLIDLDAFEGTGRLSGTLPFRIEGQKVAIDHGTLSTIKPGVIRIGSKILTDQLGGQGDTVDLTLRALSDFHYDKLALELEKPMSGEGHILAHMEGVNPAVLDGHPFVFNIRLSADFDQITEILTKSTHIADEALGWGLKNVEP